MIVIMRCPLSSFLHVCANVIVALSLTMIPSPVSIIVIVVIGTMVTPTPPLPPLAIVVIVIGKLLVHATEVGGVWLEYDTVHHAMM